MIFSNESIHLEQIPQYHTESEKHLSPKYRTVNIISWFLLFGVLAVIISVVHFQPLFELPESLQRTYGFVMALDGILAIMTIAYHFFADPLKTWSLREQDVSYSSGLFFRSTVHQPILRIQHIELQRGPIERMAGLATLQVFSAGGAMHTFQIPGLELETAQQVRQFILEHKDLSTHG